jgi:hypothetical protein
MYERLPDWFVAFIGCIFFIFLLFGIFLGCHMGVTQMRKEAINHNAAYWTVDKEGVTTFNWKTSVEAEVEK